MADEESFIWVEDEKSVDSKFEQNRKHRNQQWEAKITELLQRLVNSNEEFVKTNEELKNRVSDLIELLSKKQEYTQSPVDSESEGRQNPDDQILVLRDTLRAHTDWITAVATPVDNSDMVVTASRDNSIIFWKVNKENKTYGVHQRLSTGDDFGYAHDVFVNSDGHLALSASWDAHLLLWDLSTATSKQFLGHTDDVLSVAFSLNNPPHMLSASQDGSIKLWDTSGQCKYTFEGHTHWVTCVCFSPIENTLFASASFDKTVKIWSLTDCSLIHTLEGHKDYVNVVAISPDGSLCASGGKDAVIMLWDVAEGSWLHSVETTSVIHALCFSPNRFWLCAATETSVRIWDLESKKIVADLKVESDMVDDGTGTAGLYKVIYCTSLSWSADGSTLFSGYTDGVVRVWSIRH